MIAQTITSEQIRKWREDPVSFVTQEMHVEPDEWQIDTLRAFGNPETRRIAMRACAGPGKSAVLAWCAWNFLSCYALKGEHPNGAAVSTTSINLKDNLWKELAVWRGRSDFLKQRFEWTKERIFAREHPETWFMSARSFPKTADAEQQGRTLSGLHSRFILYLIDESGDIAPAVLRAAEQGLSNCSWGKIVQAGNPTSHQGILYHSVVSQAHLWFIVSITGDPDDPKRSKRIDITWAREQIAEYGRDNPWVMAYVLGLFPPSSINALIGVEEVEAAMRRHLTEDKYNWSQKRMGIDAARFGDDPWVIFPRQGLAAFRPAVMRNPRSQEVAARVAKAKAEWRCEREFFDDTGGYASGAIDCLDMAGHNPVPINFSGSAINPRYFNKRSEMWFEMVKWIRRGGALPPVPALTRELTVPTYYYDKGRFRLQEKEQIKKLLGMSTNYADALSLTFAEPDMPSDMANPLELPIGAQGEHKKDYDPTSVEAMAA